MTAKRPLRQRDLEILLERVPPHPSPDPNLEQYRTPAPIAADLVYRAVAHGDIQGRTVLDLGCGTGMLLAGAALMGAAHVSGVDVDSTALDVARKTLEDLGVEADLHQGRVEDEKGSFDTVIMNPPFGAQFAGRHADSVFVRQALKLAPVVYALHAEKTLEHLERLATRLGAHHRPLARYNFAIPHQFSFHTKEKVIVPIVLLRYVRGDA